MMSTIGSWSGSTTAAPRTTPPCSTPRALPRRPARRERRAGSPRARRSRSARWLDALRNVLALTGRIARDACGRSGLDTPGPGQRRRRHLAPAARRTSPHPGWRGFDFRGALEERLRLPVVYNNDGNAAALYAHYRLFGDACRRAVLGLGDRRHRPRRRRHRGRAEVIKGAAGMAGELGHVHIPMDGLLEAEPAAAAVQLRLQRRRRERRLADRASRRTCCPTG